MKSLVWLVILFAIAVGIAILTQNYHGAAHIVIENTLYSMNLNTFIAGILLLWVLLYFIVRLAKNISHMPKGFRNIGKKYKIHKADQELNDAGMAFFEGRYQQATEHTQKLLSNSEAGKRLPLALILAAYSAQANGNTKERDKFLKQIEKLPEKQQLPRYLLLTEDALNNNEYNIADAYIRSAKKINSNLPQIAKLELRSAMAQQNADGILASTNQLLKQKAISNQEAQNAKLTAYQKMVSDANDAKSLKRSLKQIPTHDKEYVLAVEIAEKYRNNGQFKELVKWINHCYPLSQDERLIDELVRIYPLLSDSEQKKILENAEKQLDNSKDNHALLCALGKMTMYKQLWGKAQNYFEAALSLQKTISSHTALADILAQIGKDKESNEHRQAALNLIVESSEDNEEETSIEI